MAGNESADAWCVTGTAHAAAAKAGGSTVINIWRPEGKNAYIDRSTAR